MFHSLGASLSPIYVQYNPGESGRERARISPGPTPALERLVAPRSFSASYLGLAGPRCISHQNQVVRPRAVFHQNHSVPPDFGEESQRAAANPK